MPAKPGKTLTVRRIFIGSPGDLAAERRIFREIIEHVNKIKANSNGIQLEALGWEDTLPGRGRPQARINQDVGKADLVVLVLWKRWGTPTGKYSSGFEEEYRVAMEEGKEIWLYFRSVPDVMLADPGPQLQQVILFRKKVEKERKLLYQHYDDENDWKTKLESHLCEWLDSPEPVRTKPRVPRASDEEKQLLRKELAKAKDIQAKAALMLAKEAMHQADNGWVTRAEEGMAADYGNLGGVYEKRHETKRAREMWTKARNLYGRLGNKSQVAKIQRWLNGLRGA